MKALALDDDDHAPSPRTTPAQALNMPSGLPAVGAAAASVAAAQAAGVYGDEIMPPVPESAIEALRARLRHLEEEEDNDDAPAGRAGGAAAAEEEEEAEAFLTRKQAFEEAFGTPFKKQAFEEKDEEEEAVGKAVRTRDGAEAFGGRDLLDLPKKRFQPNPLYEDDEADEDEDDDDEDDEDDDEDDSYEDEAEAEAAARAEQEAGGDDALAALASAVSLERLLGFSTHAHDHVLWHPEHGRLIYASGDTLMLHYYAAPGGPRQQPLRAGGGEIATLGGSDDHALVAVGAGGDAPIAVWDLSGAAPRLGVRLPGHQGGVQALAFSHSQAVGGCDLLASLGLADGSLRLSQLSTAQPLLHAALARPQHVVSWSHDNLELATGGAGGLYGWRVGWDEVDEDDGGRGAVIDGGGGGVVTLAYLEPQPARVPWSADGDGGGARDPHAQLTAVVHLAALHGDAPCILTGDTAGCLALWGEGEAPLAVWSCAHALQEIDLLHASAVDDEETMGGGSAKWVVVVAGAGPTREVLRFELRMPTDGASAPTIAPLSRTSLDGAAVGMAWSDGAAQGVVGTDAGNIWHVHWASPQPATPLVSAVPPPMTQLAMPRQLCSSGGGGGGGGGGGQAPPPAVMATVSRGTVMDGAACGVLLWDARRAGCAQPLARVHFATDVATCVALSPTSGGRDGEGETALAIGYASGAVRLLYVDQLAMEPTPLCQHDEAVVALAFAPHGRVLSATAAGDVRLSSVAEGSQTVRGAPPPLPPPPTSTRASIYVAAARTHIDALDVLPMNLPGLTASACWLCATAAQEVQVWPLSLPIVPDQRAGEAASVSAAAAAAAAPPLLAQLQLERDDALISLPTEMQPLGWRCLAVFCPYHPQLVAACGVTQRKQVRSCPLLAPEP